MAAQEAAQSQQTQGVPESRILQARQANASWLTDPTVFAVNRKPAHSNHRYFLGEATEPKQNLDGVWKVNVTQAASIDVENAPFAAADFNDAGFGAINVPEHLQMAGYLKNKYVNVQYPWDGHEDRSRVVVGGCELSTGFGVSPCFPRFADPGYLTRFLASAARLRVFVFAHLDLSVR